MGFHKHIFPIRMIEAAENPIEIVAGWCDETYVYGFHKIHHGRAWAATDLYSGMRVCAGTTRKICMEWIEKNSKKIEKRRKEPFYIWRVLEFRDLIKKELEEL